MPRFDGNFDAKVITREVCTRLWSTSRSGRAGLMETALVAACLSFEKRRQSGSKGRHQCSARAIPVHPIVIGRAALFH